jgi:hypothetical protein
METSTVSDEEIRRGLRKHPHSSLNRARPGPLTVRLAIVYAVVSAARSAAIAATTSELPR